MKSSPHLPLLSAIVTGITLVSSACARGTVRAEDSSGGAGAGSGSTTAPISGAGGSFMLTLPTSSAGGAGADANSGGSSGDGAMVVCTDGAHCACPTLSVAVVGRPGVWGDSSDTAFQDWLNSRSAGTATVDNFLAKPTFTPDFLAGYKPTHPRRPRGQFQHGALVDVQ